MNTGAKMLAVALAMSVAMPAWAVTFREGEAQLRQAYGAYRAALFLSNQGKQAETAAALEKFDGAWSQIVAGWTIDPPPQYAEDTALAETFTTVNGQGICRPRISRLKKCARPWPRCTCATISSASRTA